LAVKNNTQGNSSFLDRLELHSRKYVIPGRFLQTAKETPIFLGGLFQPPRNIFSLRVKYHHQGNYPFLAVSFWHSRKFLALKAIPVSCSE
jgi:hypothetical protein